MSNKLSRRRFGMGLTAAISLSIAGCLDGDDDEAVDDVDDTDDVDDADDSDDSDDSDDADDGDDGDEAQDDVTEHELTIHLENDDGDTVSDGVIVTVDLVDDIGSDRYFGTEIAEGTVVDTFEEGEYLVTVEPDDYSENDFEPEEEDVTLDEDVTLEFVIDAIGDEARAEEEDEDE